MRLFVIVYRASDNDEADWLTTVRDAMYISSEDERKLAQAHCAEHYGCEPEEVEIVECWSERLDVVDGYKIILEKEK